MLGGQQYGWKISLRNNIGYGGGCKGSCYELIVYYSLKLNNSPINEFDNCPSSLTYLISKYIRRHVECRFYVPFCFLGCRLSEKKGWNFFEHKVTGVASVTVTGSLTIDELRLYLADAKMTTNTYDPLMGITSQCDPANRVAYYEYDGIGRLKVLRDMDGNVLRVHDYQYKK